MDKVPSDGANAGVPPAAAAASGGSGVAVSAAAVAPARPRLPWMDAPAHTLLTATISRSELAAVIADVKARLADACRVGGPLYNGVMEDIAEMSKPGGAIRNAIDRGLADACAPDGCFTVAMKDCLNTACSPGGAMYDCCHDASRNAAARASNGARGKDKGARLERLATLTKGVPEGFPPTVEALNRLTAAQLVALLTAYKQPTGGSLSELRARFSSFIGVT